MPTKNTTTKTQSSKKDQHIKNLEAQLKALTEQLNNLAKTTPEVAETRTVEINPSKKTRVISLTCGSLSLYAQARGFLIFPDFGSVKNLPYAHLIDYVNSCRSAAEEGSFYICDQQMVEDLGLSEAYQKILSDKVIKNILSGALDITDDEVAAMVADATNSQKASLALLVIDGVYNGEITDMRLIDKLSQILNVQIFDKVTERRKLAEIEATNKQ